MAKNLDEYNGLKVGDVVFCSECCSLSPLVSIEQAEEDDYWKGVRISHWDGEAEIEACSVDPDKFVSKEAMENDIGLYSLYNLSKRIKELYKKVLPDRQWIY